MLHLDIHDADIYPLLSQVCPVKLESLNPALPDIFYTDIEGTTKGISRKQVGEMLSSLHAVEEQLSRDYQTVDELDLIIEGIIVPASHSTVHTMRWSQDGKLAFRSGKRRHGDGKDGSVPFDFSYLGYRKKLHSFMEAGIHIYEVPDRPALINQIQALWEHSQTNDRTTFKRVLRTKIQMPSANPYLRTLMGLCDPETARTFIGQSTAEALEKNGLARLSELSRATVEGIAEVRLESGRRIGVAMAERIKRSIGE